MAKRGKKIPWRIKKKVLEEKVKVLDHRFKEALVTFQGVIHSLIKRTTDEEIKPLLKAALTDQPYRTDNLVRKMIKDRKITGECTICSINCYGTEAMPRKVSFPCGLYQCPFEVEKLKKKITIEESLETLTQVKKDYLYD